EVAAEPAGDAGDDPVVAAAQEPPRRRIDRRCRGRRDLVGGGLLAIAGASVPVVSFVHFRPPGSDGSDSTQADRARPLRLYGMSRSGPASIPGSQRRFPGLLGAEPV